MIYIWKKNYNESMGAFFARTIKDRHHKDIFNMLWGSFRLTYIIESSFFKSIHVGDDKYILWVYIDNNGVLTVQFMIQ